MRSRPITKTRDLGAIRLVCANCGNASLALEGQPSLHETPSSKKAHEDEAWDPLWVSEHFSACFKCGIKGCGQEVLCIGKVSYYDLSTYDEMNFEPEYEFEYFSPAIHLMDVPEKTPEPVKQMINQSMALFFTSPSSASNCLRIAVERLLDHQGIKKYNKSSKTSIKLHLRIAEFSNTRNKTVGDKLLAIKWIGNHGSHNSDLTHESMADSYEIFESALMEMFDDKADALKKKIGKINKRRKP